MNGPEMIYTIPINGTYVVSSKMVRFEPTGEFETIKNPHYRWWKFLSGQPKMIQREIMRQVETWDGREVKVFSAGDEIKVPVSTKAYVQRIQ